jgi:hypothetical protein
MKTYQLSLSDIDLKFIEEIKNYSAFGGAFTVSIKASKSPPNVLVMGFPSRLRPSKTPSSTKSHNANLASDLRLIKPK